MSVLVADFDNRTGEAVFDDTLEPMFNVALEGASFLNAFNRGQARKLASGLPKPSDKLDPETARLVAVSKGIPVVVSGSLTREGKGYRIAVRAVDARTGGSIASPEAAVNTKDEILPAIPRLVTPIRKALGDSTPASVQLESAGGAFTAASLETVHQYSLGMQRQFTGDSEQALRSFSKAVELDPGFARAYAGMAGVAIKLGQLHEADSYIKLAMEHTERMTDRERYRVRGLYYLSAGNWQKCAEEYGELVKRYPGDNIGHNNLAICLGQSRNLARAVEEARHDLQFNPNASAAANLSLFSSYAGDFQGGERAARELQQAYPSFRSAISCWRWRNWGKDNWPRPPTATTASRRRARWAPPLPPRASGIWPGRRALLRCRPHLRTGSSRRPGRQEPRRGSREADRTGCTRSSASARRSPRWPPPTRRWRAAKP